MENIVFRYGEDQLSATAQGYFEGMCGVCKDNNKAKAMAKQALELKNKIFDRIDVRGIYSIYSGDSLESGKLTIEGMDFSFAGISLLAKESTYRIIPFILTSGNYEMEETNSILDQFYADTYGTAYVDAARDELKKNLLKNAKKDLAGIEKELYISDSIGPGFYGMANSMVENFFKILNYKKINVSMNSYNVIIPVKSCVGLFIITDDEKMLPHYDCMSCSTKTKNCRFCRLKSREIDNGNSK
ncbi:MAG: hypothetical protein WCF96_08445 [Eubacteriales bacterium]